MRRYLKVCFFFSLVASVHAFAAHFPKLTLYGAGGESSIFPSGKTELVFLGFQSKAKDELPSWYKFLLKEKKLLKNTKCTILPVLPSWMSFAMSSKPFFMACQNKLPKEVVSHVKITFCNGEALATELGLALDKGDLEHIHVYYLNEQGTICWHTAGAPTPEVLRQFHNVAALN